MFTLENFESKIEAHFDIYSSTVFNYTTSSNQGHVNNIGDITINQNKDNIIPPFISNNVLYITMGQTAKINGNYFGQQKRQGYKLLLNGNEIVTKTWKSDLIEFDVPNAILEEGTIQIDRDGALSREVNYEEGDWTCEIGGILYDNNNLPIENGNYYIIFSNKSLDIIPNCIGNLKNLELLELRRNQLSSLPESFGNLQNLQGLHLSNNQISSLPESIGNLQNLQNLVLSSNQLTTLPDSFGNLQNLQNLVLSSNQLSSLPESIKNLKDNLKILLLSGNYFSLEERAKIEEWLPNTDITW